MSIAVKKRVFFPNLNGVRFVAAMMVVVHHIEQIKQLCGLPSAYNNPFINKIGGLGVTLFFVLSGFLITYLLLEEKREFQTINLKEFYIRRILRIWPLYYLIILLAFYIIPTFFSSIIIADFGTQLNVDYTKKLVMYVFFIPNVAFITQYPVLFASQAWSIGVEEQFYAIWPVLVKLFKKSLYVMITIVCLYLVINITLENLVKTSVENALRFGLYKDFFRVTRIDCMAVGGLFAYLALHKNRLATIVQNKVVQLFAYVMSIVVIYTGTVLNGLGDLPFAILFGIIIFNLALNQETIVRLNNSVFEYGGKISYGIYMYHPVGVVLTFFAFFKMKVPVDGVWTNILAYSISIMLTLLLSSLSYQFYEKYFLRKKLKFSSIISGDNALEGK